jgi:hypothetical protein
MMTAPCLNCENRKVGCHSTCEEYIKFDKERKEIRAKMFAENELRGFDRERWNTAQKRLRKKR